MSTVGFEYKKKGNETPFETFLRYTDEKEKSATKLATVLRKELHEHSSILDVGTGNGEYLQLALGKIELPDGVALNLVEPSEDLFEQLEQRFKRNFPDEHLEIIKSDLQDFESDEQFDVILMSHLFYHIPRATWAEQLAKALSLLKPTGKLIIVLRDKDDAYDFKMAFKPLLFDESFKALTVDDVLAALPSDVQVEIERHSSASELNLPFRKNLDDTISIIEFYLNKPWDDMPEAIQRSALDFIKDKDGMFKQLDGIAVIKKA